MNQKNLIPGGTFPMFCIFLVVIMLISGGCATAPTPPPMNEPAPKPVQTLPEPEREVRSSEYAILTAIPTDSYESLARVYFGDEKLAYLISEFNGDAPILLGKEVVIPLKPANPGGIYPDGYQTVPVLVYHKISPKKSSSKITVSEETFERQMAYLKNNGYHVLTMKQFLDFIDFRRRPPKKSVVITLDDGWKSARTIAYPILKKYGFTAVLFLYTDLVGSNQTPLALSWDDVRTLKASGVFEIGSHTVTHNDLNKVSDDQMQRELRESRRIIFEKTGVTTDLLAYPNGVFNEKIIKAMKNMGYRAGFTVIRGGNPFFNNPFSLNRSMVYNSEKLDNFIKLLETFKRK
jgi:peptidoglycan/xylan/chitin deacetylase (PgdA/CDA1 family)